MTMNFNLFVQCTVYVQCTAYINILGIVKDNYVSIKSDRRGWWLKVISMDSLYCLGNSLLHCYNTLQQVSENNKNITLLLTYLGNISK